MGVSDNRSDPIPHEVEDAQGNISKDPNIIVDKWKTDFCLLLHVTTDSSIDCNIDCVQLDHDVIFLNEDVFTIADVGKAIYDVKNSKAIGCDELPSNVFKNDNVVCYLHKLFSNCYNTGKIPHIWGKSIINPIPKSSTANTRDPMCI